MAVISNVGRLSAIGAQELPPSVIFYTPLICELTYIVFVSVGSIAIEKRTPTAPSLSSFIRVGPIEIAGAQFFTVMLSLKSEVLSHRC
jgi:hypothetical protein